MARSLDQILKELDAAYNPSRDIINQRLGALPAEADAEIAGLKAQEQDYFDNTIMTGARNRGLGFSGIPDSERARYGSTQFLPAVARVRQGQNERKLSLMEALNGMMRDQRDRAQNIYQTELDREEAARQAELNRQAELARSRAAAAPLASLFNTGVPSRATAAAGTATSNLKITPALQQLFNQVFIKADGQQWSDKELLSDYNATLKSARYGNARDKQKISLYHSVRPDLFGASVPAAVLSNRVSF